MVEKADQLLGRHPGGSWGEVHDTGKEEGGLVEIAGDGLAGGVLEVGRDFGGQEVVEQCLGGGAFDLIEEGEEHCPPERQG